MINQITIPVDTDLAQAYITASDEQRQKLNLLMNLRLRDATQSQEPLDEVISRISANAKNRGLTAEILKELLDE